MPITRDNTPRFIERVEAATVAALRGYGREMVRDIRGLIGTPYPPASRPGTPPHTRTGQLIEGVGAYVTAGDNIAELTVSSSRESRPKVPFWLEKGTRKMAARPFMTPTVHDVVTNGLDPICRHIRANLGGGDA